MEKIKKLNTNDARDYLSLLRQLDGESEFMLYEKYERKATVGDVVGHLQSVCGRKNQAVFGYYKIGDFNCEKLVGYLSLFGGKQKRLYHTCTLSVGVVKDSQGEGISNELWQYALDWAILEKIGRVELSVMSTNRVAILMYCKWGFGVCGYLRDRLRLGNVWVSELMMEYLVAFGE